MSFEFLVLRFMYLILIYLYNRRAFKDPHIEKYNTLRKDIKDYINKNIYFL